MVKRKKIMFNFFKKKTAEKSLEEWKKEWVPATTPEKTYYSLGPSTEGRVILQVNYGNVSLNEKGIDLLIKALETSKMWLDESGKQPEDGCQEEEQPV